MKNVFIVDIEPLETRYTAQWSQHLPKIIADGVKEPVVIHSVGGEVSSFTPTDGAFLDFAATNIYKGEQVKRLAKRFQLNGIKDGDHIIFLDAWHPGIINVRYMRDLLGVDVKLHGLWHAGSYDPQDFLGRLIENKKWSFSFERTIHHALDYNWYATAFHMRMFLENLSINYGNQEQTGWPMDYMADTLAPFANIEKKDTILFPHRLAPEKQPDIFRDLAKELPQYNFVVCQDKVLTKDEYHKLLGEAKMVFSANLQETLGISAYEGALLGAMPLVPNSLSYVEMYDDTWKYPSEWTNGFSNYLKYKEELKERIVHMMDTYSSHCVPLNAQAQSLTTDFFTAGNLIAKLR